MRHKLIQGALNVAFVHLLFLHHGLKCLACPVEVLVDGGLRHPHGVGDLANAEPSQMVETKGEPLTLWKLTESGREEALQFAVRMKGMAMFQAQEQPGAPS
jgi:hypothetical protein